MRLSFLQGPNLVHWLVKELVKQPNSAARGEVLASCCRGLDTRGVHVQRFVPSSSGYLIGGSRSADLDLTWQ